MKKRPALGRGIDALFTPYEEEAQQAGEERVQLLPLDLLDPSLDQPRKRFDPEKLEQLAASLREVGVLQPLVVTPKGDRYQILAGERRWRAARLANLSEVPCLVRDAEALQRMQIALIENLQRDDLNPVETALGLQKLMRDCRLTQEEAAARVGKSRPAVANLLRLLALPDEVLDLLSEGALSEGHARALLGLKDKKAQAALAQRIVQEGLNVRQAEALVRAANEKKPAKPARKKPSQLAELALLEEAARRTFGVKVSVSGSAEKGSLTLHYKSAEELMRIYEALGGESDE